MRVSHPPVTPNAEKCQKNQNCRAFECANDVAMANELFVPLWDLQKGGVVELEISLFQSLSVNGLFLLGQLNNFKAQTNQI